MRRLILASTSPRRKELMQKVFGTVECVSPNYEEANDSPKKPIILAKEHALKKAESVAANYHDAIIIGSDTIVVLKNKVLGKPKDAEEAKSMLKKLSGKKHTVISGIAVIDTKTKKKLVDYDKTDVFFKKLSDKEINDYVATGEPLDKAGSYGIQAKGIIFIPKIYGDYFTVMGLPVFKLNKLLNKMGVSVFSK